MIVSSLGYIVRAGPGDVVDETVAVEIRSVKVCIRAASPAGKVVAAMSSRLARGEWCNRTLEL